VHFSIVVPAHNEERLLPSGLDAIADARAYAEREVEVVVVANRCTDATIEVAARTGATIVESDARNIAAVRNAGAAAATGDVLVTIDADSRMARNALVEVHGLLASARFVGGGTKVVPERSSAGLRATYARIRTMSFLTGLSGAMFWCARDDFEAVGGFDERLLVAEDLDFALRLRRHGRRTNRRFVELRTAPMVASTRKFDEFGDWHMFRMAAQLRSIRAAYQRTDAAWADRYFYDFNDHHWTELPDSPRRVAITAAARRRRAFARALRDGARD
jgi:glycosyltransferase involved in cell wall biosynthesis